MDEAVPPTHAIFISASVPCKLVRWHVQLGDRVQKGRMLCTYVQQADSGSWDEREQNVRSSVVGVVIELLQKEGAVIQPGTAVAKVEENCDHSVVVYDLCALCGRNLRKPLTTQGVASKHPHSATVSMIHGIPELRISRKEAEVLGNRDMQRLLKCQKLALVVDLDQTLIHTSMDPNIESGLPDVVMFTLPGYPAHYHCRLRPYVHSFLKQVSQFYELHVFTMGTKSYAKRVTEILDPGKRLFCDRIISRDECFDPTSKVLQLKSVFPCGDSMVAIIDDREDVWGGCPNLVHVKPYVFFAGTADINAPSSPHGTPPSPEGGAHLRPDPHRPLKRRFLSSGATVPVRREQPPAAFTAAPAFHPPPVVRPQGGTPEVAPSGTGHASLNSNSNNSNSGGHGNNNEDEGDDEGDGEGGNDEGDGDEGDGEGGNDEGDDEGDEGGGEGGNDEGDDEGDEGGGEGGNDEGGDKGDSSSSSSSSSESSDSEGGGSGGSSSSGIDDSLFEPGSNPPLSGDQGHPSKLHGGEVTITENSGGGLVQGPDQVLPTGDSKEGSVAGGMEGVSVTQEGVDIQPEIVDVCVMEAGSKCGDAADVAIGGEHLQPIANDEILGSQSKPLTSSPLAQSEHKTGPLAQSEHKAGPLAQSEHKAGLLAQSEHMASAPATATPREINDSDDFLHYLGDTLQRIHATFYSQYQVTKKEEAEPPAVPDLKEIIPHLRRSVLKGARVLFTGVIPTNTPPQRSPEWCTAVAFGAVVHEELVPGLHSCDHRKAQRATTHIIVGRPGTSKLKEARRMPGIKVVSPAWLWACAERWQWVEEKSFPLGFEHSAKERGGKGRGPLKGEGLHGWSELEDKDAKRTADAVKGGGDGAKEVKCDVERTAKEEEDQEGEEEEVEVVRAEEKETKDWEGAGEEEEPKSGPSRSRRHQVTRLDSYLSVSDEELEKMEAEVDAEIGDSSNDTEEEEEEDVEGTAPVEERQPQKEEGEEEGALFRGLHPEVGMHLAEELEEEGEGSYGRKRKRVDVESNSSNSAEKVEEESSIEDDDGSGMDDLALLLAGDD